MRTAASILTVACVVALVFMAAAGVTVAPAYIATVCLLGLAVFVGSTSPC